jgi:hypothetical protein
MDLEELRLAIRAMKPRQRLYKVLKEELHRQGHWKDLPRGNPEKGNMSIRRG